VRDAREVNPGTTVWDSCAMSSGEANPVQFGSNLGAVLRAISKVPLLRDSFEMLGGRLGCM